MKRSLAIVLLPLLFAASGECVQAADPGRLPETVSRIERETGGRVLSAQKSQRGGREVNRIKVLTPDGRVRVMWDEPQPRRIEAPRAGERSGRPASDAARQATIERGVRPAAEVARPPMIERDSAGVAERDER